MHLGLWASDDDETARAVAARARTRGHDVTTITPTRQGADATDLGSWLIGGEDPDACTVHLVRALPTPIVAPRPGEDPDALALRAFVTHERVMLAHAALSAAEARGVRVCNPMASVPFESKPHQLAALTRAGIPVPRTMITSVPFAAQRFVTALQDEGLAAIVKPLIGGATARLVDDSTRARLDLLADSPVILQERIPGDDVRLTVVGGVVVSAVVIESSALDYRDDPAYAGGGARYRVIDVSAELSALAAQVARCCHHVISGVDVKRAPDGRVVVLEANAAPRWLDIENKTGARITDAVVTLLEG